MELILQQLPHQDEAVKAICKAFEGVYMAPPCNYYENPVIELSSPKLITNIKQVQKSIPVEFRSVNVGDYLNLDIKMETGTGKTYVYTKTMFELHKHLGFNKFIIAVPSLSIKAGVAQFLNDDYVKRHFSDECGYGFDIDVGILEAPKNSKKGRSFFPGVVSDFVKGSCQNNKKIHVLLLNMQLLTNAKMLSRSDYDYGVEGFYKPLDAIKATKPVLIIDEPHRFSKDQKAFKTIIDDIKPQCIVRFGATFPEVTTGRGRNKVTTKDYQNLIYDLNACKAFEQGLIKGVAKEHFEPVSKKEEKIKISSIESKEAVHIQYKKRNEATKSFTLRKGDALSIITDAFTGISVSEIDSNKSVLFSNGISKKVGEELDVDIFMTSYQEQMLRLALQRHFETEKENFCNRKYKIKTLALFFIDDIASYRGSKDGEPSYLLDTFERLLKEEITKNLLNLDEHETEYREYLLASLDDISACHAGYFAQDNSDSDEDIAKEVDIILNGKKRLLSFRNENGKYNTTRFLFSKWTLKEGWDNPNIFTIAKLRSSGSEISKLQEVGRGLRLPVDENGNRISNESFMLNYIVDFTEADFAQKLVEEINREIPLVTSISDEQLHEVADKRGLSDTDLLIILLQNRYVDINRNIIFDNKESFFEEFPEFSTNRPTVKIKDRNKEKNKTIKIRPDAFFKIKELWEKINQRYNILYDNKLNDNLEDVVLTIFEKKGVFAYPEIVSQRDIVQSNDARTEVSHTAGVQYSVFRTIPYGVFLKRISSVTNIPIKTIHSALCIYSKKHGREFESYINDYSASNFCKEFFDWKNAELQGHFRYVKGQESIGETALSFSDGRPRSEISLGRIGTKIAPGEPCDKYLYDTCAYDSPLEKDNIMSDIEDVVVYGKIPRNSIAIPTITGGMYSPDFMYVVQYKNGEKSLNIVVETKDVDNETDLRGIEEIKIHCAEVFFNSLSKDGYKVYFRKQLNNRQMNQIINEVVGTDSTFDNQ